MVGELRLVLFEIAEATAVEEVADADEAALKKLSALEGPSPKRSSNTSDEDPTLARDYRTVLPHRDRVHPRPANPSRLSPRGDGQAVALREL